MATPLPTVPAAIVPETFNVLLNPAHPDAKHIVVVEATNHAIDPGDWPADRSCPTLR